jgi:hypothetical protein
VLTGAPSRFETTVNCIKTIEKGYGFFFQELWENLEPVQRKTAAQLAALAAFSGAWRPSICG